MSDIHDDEEFFEQVAAELEAGNTRQGLWLKAETKAGGDKEKARLLYIEWRVEQLSEGQRREAQLLKEEAELEAREKAAAETKDTQRKLEQGQGELESSDVLEALKDTEQYGYIWTADYSFTGDFRGWLISKTGHGKVRLRSKAELQDWIKNNIPQ